MTCKTNHVELVRINRSKGFESIACPDCKVTVYITPKSRKKLREFCDDCHRRTCIQCGNCDCDGFPCEHQRTIKLERELGIANSVSEERYSDEELAELHLSIWNGSYVQTNR